MRRQEGFPDPWEAPVSYTARSMAKLLRDALDKLGWEYERETSEKVYDKLMVIMPLMRIAHVHRFVVSEPVEIVIDTYDTRPTHSSHMPYLAIRGVGTREIPVVRKLLEEVAAAVERPPWEFTLAQKVNHGMIMPEFKNSRRAWSLFGFDSYKKWKPTKSK